MRILYFDYDDVNNPYASGGQAYSTSELVKKLSLSHEVTVVTGKYPSAKNVTKGNITFIRLGVGNLGFTISLISHWILMPFYAMFHQKNYDLIVECFTGPFTVSLLPLVANKPLIAIASFFGSEMLSKKYHLPVDFFINVLLRRYKHVVTLTQEMSDNIKKFCPQATIRVIPGGVNKTLLEKIPENGEYVLYLGRIDVFNKGLDLLVQSWNDIDCNLVIVGNGRSSDTKYLNELITKHQLNEKVKLIGRLDGEEKYTYYSNSLFVVQPTLFETFGYVALETLAAGKVLVCFDIEGYKWIPQDNAVKIKERSVKALKDSINDTLKNTRMLEMAKAKNKEFARRFDWDVITDSYLNFFQDVYEKRI